MPNPQLTTHFEMDVPDELVGKVRRYLVGIRGISNLEIQTNGVAKKKGDSPSKMNDSTMRDVILDFVSRNGPNVELARISEAVEAAGFSSAGLSGQLTPLVESRLLTRVERGVYSAQKALPAPKKGAPHGR